MSTSKIPLRVYLGIPFAIISLYLGIRLTIEQTLWTWERGLQMVGFSLAHGVGILLYPLLIMGVVWALVHVIISLYKRSFGGWPGITVLVLFLLGFGLMNIPYDFWQKLFIENIRNSPNAYQQFEYSLDNPKRIKFLLKKGFPVDLKNQQGQTPLQRASEAGFLATAKLLIEQGANLNATDDAGNSALYLAKLNHREDVAELLKAHGAKSIKGSETQHLNAEKKKFLNMMRLGNEAMGEYKPSDKTLKQMEEKLWEQHLRDKEKKEDFKD